MQTPFDPNFPLAERLKTIRTKWKLGKLSQETLAQMAGIPTITYIKMEKGHTKNPSFLTVWKLIDTLWYSLDEFVSDPGNEFLGE